MNLIRIWENEQNSKRICRDIKPTQRHVPYGANGMLVVCYISLCNNDIARISLKLRQIVFQRNFALVDEVANLAES